MRSTCIPMKIYVLVAQDLNWSQLQPSTQSLGDDDYWAPDGTAYDVSSADHMKKCSRATYKQTELPPKNTNTDNDNMRPKDGGLEPEKNCYAKNTRISSVIFTSPARPSPCLLAVDDHRDGFHEVTLTDNYNMKPKDSGLEPEKNCYATNTPISSVISTSPARPSLCLLAVDDDRAGFHEVTITDKTTFGDYIMMLA